MQKSMWHIIWAVSIYLGVLSSKIRNLKKCFGMILQTNKLPELDNKAPFLQSKPAVHPYLACSRGRK